MSRRAQLRGHPGGMFASLSVHNYRLYFWGQSISVVGTWMQNVAFGWLVLQMTGSGTALGAVTALRFVPILVAGPYGGLLADRLNRRRLLVATQASSAVLSGTFALVVWLHAESLVLVYVLALALGLVNVIANPARQTLVNDLVPQELLPNAVALNSISTNVARVVGPLVAGVLIVGLGVAPCFAINAVSFIGVLVSLLALRVDELFPKTALARARGQIRAGFRYVVRTPSVLLPMGMIAVIGIFVWEFQVTLPLVATGSFLGTAGTYGWMMAGLGLGAAGSGFWVARSARVTIRSAALSSVALGIGMGAAAAAPSIYAAVPILVVVGWCTVSFSVRAKSLLQLNAAPEMRGRVMAIWVVAWQGTTPIGGPLVGSIGEHLGPRWSLIAGAIPAVLVGLAAFFIDRGLRSRLSGAPSVVPAAAGSAVQRPAGTREEECAAVTMAADPARELHTPNMST